VPGLAFLEVVAGLLQIVWFLWFGIITVRIGPADVDRDAAPDEQGPAAALRR